MAKALSFLIVVLIKVDGTASPCFREQKDSHPQDFSVTKNNLSFGVSQKGSRERCLPFFSENETGKNGKNGRKRKERKKTERKQEKTEKKRKEKIGSDTVPATPFVKARALLRTKFVFTKDPNRLYKGHFRDLVLRSRPPFTGVPGPGPESAPRSAFGAILGTCLGVPQRVFFECFLAFFGS